MKRSLLLASFLAMLSWSALTAQAASDYLLELDGIKGESRDPAQPGSVEVQSFSWGATNAGTTTAGGGGAGKATFQDLHFTCPLSKASPELFLACATGTHIKQAVLHVRKAGGSQDDYYVITLTDVLVSSFQQGGQATPDSRPTESFSLNFSKIEWSYTAADGSVVKGGWDVKANVKV